MTSQAQTDSGHAVVSMRRLWFGFVGGPGAWAVHEMVVASLAGWACADGSLELGAVSGGGMRAILAAITAAAILVGAAAVLVAWRSWKRLTNGSHGTEASSSNTAAFMAIAGVLVSSLALVGMLYAALPLAFVDACGKLL